MNDMIFKLPQFIDFKESFVAFIDILGFKKKVESIKTQDDFDKIATLMLAIKESSIRFNQENDLFSGTEIIAVSDSLIITIPYTDIAACFKTIELMRYFQYHLLVKNFKTILRGYLHKGLVYNKDGMIFGPGYITAYEQERKIGGAPRIVVSPEIIKLADNAVKRDKSNKISIFDRLRKDTDEQYYVDYLLPYGDAVESGYPKSDQFKDLSSVPSYIDYNIKKFQEEPNIQKKYIWLKEYFECTKNRLEQLV
ncbi:MAG: hypothetical protein KKC46_07430 [Proteobacteria bacterium]|nr:hypothetical protein [Pseudomonadota bacterium]